tara:strand:- start:82 stop:288 length:207 start_codon:yes stop_codon:yes gene_type:complete
LLPTEEMPEQWLSFAKPLPNAQGFADNGYSFRYTSRATLGRAWNASRTLEKLFAIRVGPQRKELGRHS